MSTEIEKRETDAATKDQQDGTQDQRDEAVVEADAEEGVEASAEASVAADGTAEDAADDDAEHLDHPAEQETPAAPGVGQGAAAVVSAGLGIVALTGSWVGTIASARASLVGQLETSSTASVAKQVEAVYGNAWHATALVGGAFALLALLVGAFVLARPAFGAPGRVVQAPWVKSVAWAGVALGVIGLLLAVAKYLDLFMGLPSTS
ncbi:hypothetical protein H9Y04_02990 [Streptomyces sp. TRM66268-LWL]|uniref:Integral membrane protein n=1 Tax=Streptomyces polyasparticus TaxID=2767826 RepID=A0ABR7SB20_9ACTN|nr:hypothetical protein [Streptomyces polyasparticus]MBC9711538.1 hypothetical protein [Streptomyces polyasparticus]